ncbi:MAG: hypothetical protein ACLQFF_06795 [Steroidobacteraceae bacterium]|jgi:hypothetical protein
MTITDQVQQIIKKAARRDRSPRMIRRLLSVKLLEERGGLPQGPGESPRPIWAQVRELAVQLERLAEMIERDRPLDDSVLTGRTLIHKAIMINLSERGYCECEFGALRYQGDVWVQQRIDAVEDVRR